MRNVSHLRSPARSTFGRPLPLASSAAPEGERKMKQDDDSRSDKKHPLIPPVQLTGRAPSRAAPFLLERKGRGCSILLVGKSRFDVTIYAFPPRQSPTMTGIEPLRTRGHPWKPSRAPVDESRRRQGWRSFFGVEQRSFTIYTRTGARLKQRL